MKSNTRSLQDLFVDELADLYDAESQLTKAMPKIAEAARTSELQKLLQDHLEQTKVHTKRLTQIMEHVDGKARGRKCKAMAGLIEEGNDQIKDNLDAPTLDAALIAAIQRVEHYEIAGYGCAATYAELLGDHESAKLLKQTLDEEKEEDKKLTNLATSTINLYCHLGSQKSP
jgi:ferritin-like metal-binding protein YciE